MELIYHTIFQISPIFVILLKCYSKVINILESDSTPFCYAHHLIQQAKMKTFEIVNIYCPNMNDLAKDLNECIENRLRWGGGDLSAAFYLLTLQGKKEYYETYCKPEKSLNCLIF